MAASSEAVAARQCTVSVPCSGWLCVQWSTKRCDGAQCFVLHAQPATVIRRALYPPELQALPLSFPIPPRSLPRPELLVLFVVELVVQVVVLVQVVQVLLVKLVLVQLVVEVLVQVLVLFEVSELFVETVAAALERPVRRLTGQHCHPQLGLGLMVNEPSGYPPPPGYDSSAARALRASLRR